MCIVFLYSLLFSIATISLAVSTTNSSTETSNSNVYPYSLNHNQTTLPPLPMTKHPKKPNDHHPSNETDKEVHLQPLEDSQNHVVHLEEDHYEKRGRLQQLVDIFLQQDLSSVNKDNLKQIVRKYHDLYLDDKNKDVTQTEQEHNGQLEHNPDEDQIQTVQLLERYNDLNKGRNYFQPFVIDKYLHDDQFDDLHLPMIGRKMHFEEIPLMQKKQTQAEIMRSLDNYTMQRKKTNHAFLSPELHYKLNVNNILRHNNSKPKRSVLSSSDSDFQTNGNFKSESDDNDKFREKLKIEITKPKVFKEKNSEGRFVRDNEIKSQTLNPQMAENFDITELQNQNMLDTLKEQSEKMYDLIHQIQKESKRRSAFSDFEKILLNVEERKKKAKEAKKTSTTTTTTVMPVQEMLIDETMVKEALRNDPYVKRILNLSNKKKEEFLKTLN